MKQFIILILSLILQGELFGATEFIYTGGHSSFNNYNILKNKYPHLGLEYCCQFPTIKQTEMLENKSLTLYLDAWPNLTVEEISYYANNLDLTIHADFFLSEKIVNEMLELNVSKVIFTLTKLPNPHEIEMINLLGKKGELVLKLGIHPKIREMHNLYLLMENTFLTVELNISPSSSQAKYWNEISARKSFKVPLYGLNFNDLKYFTNTDFILKTSFTPTKRITNELLSKQKFIREIIFQSFYFAPGPYAFLKGLSASNIALTLNSFVHTPTIPSQYMDLFSRTKNNILFKFR